MLRPQSSTSDMKVIRRLAPQIVLLAVCGLAYILVLYSRRACQPTTHPTSPQIAATSITASTPTTTPTRPTVPARVVRAPFYLKTHKTGSSTIAHHLLYFTRMHKLTTLRAPGHILVSTPNPTSQRYDAIVAHHTVFNLSLLRTYLHREPDLLLTSIRLPLQRQVSWFRQQNQGLGNVSCEVRNDTLLAHFDAWYPKRAAPQIALLREAGARDALGSDVQRILDQFDFVFVKERLRESFECFCEKTGIRLCNDAMPMVAKNVRGGSCVESQLLKYRAAELLRGGERDLLLYEAAGERLGCRVSEWCRCPVL